MSDFRIFQVAGSALDAQNVRLNTIASNLANANVAASSPEEAYRARMPVFTAQPDASMEGAVRVSVSQVVQSDAEPVPRYQPDHPQADEAGYVYMPNVNTVEQMADMISASRSYQTNLEVMNTTKDLMMQTLQLGR